jgi:hydrogenase expression/formation protein HypC
MCLAVPGKLIAIDQTDLENPTGEVDFSGIIKEVSLVFLPEAKIGDYVIVHVGFALSLLEESEARRVFEYLEQMDGLDELKDQPS